MPDRTILPFSNSLINKDFQLNGPSFLLFSRKKHCVSLAVTPSLRPLALVAGDPRLRAWGMEDLTILI